MSSLIHLPGPSRKALILSHGSSALGAALHMTSDGFYAIRDAVKAAVGGDSPSVDAILQALRDGKVTQEHILTLNTLVGTDWVLVALALMAKQYKAAGYLQASATVLMVYQALHAGETAKIDWPQVIGPTVGFLPQAAAFSREDAMRVWGDRNVDSKVAWRRRVAPAAQYSVVTGAMLGVLGGVFLLGSGTAEHDTYFLYIFLTWILAELLVGAGDERLIQTPEQLERIKAENLKSRLSPAATRARALALEQMRSLAGSARSRPAKAVRVALAKLDPVHWELKAAPAITPALVTPVVLSTGRSEQRFVLEWREGASEGKLYGRLRETAGDRWLVLDVKRNDGRQMLTVLPSRAKSP